MELKFPPEFYFGASTSAHQVEGNNFNDWTEWEQKTASIKRQASSGRKWPKFILDNYPNPLQEENYLSSRAADHYNEFVSDFDLAMELGHNAHRFSIEWSRIEPEEGVFQKKELTHYEAVIDALRKRKIEPFVTLWHWTLPPWVAKRGGVQNKNFPRYFSRFTEKIVKALGNKVRFWITLNEPEIYSKNGYYCGKWPPQKRGIINYYRALAKLILAHRAAYKSIEEIAPHASVGISCNLSYFDSAPGFINSSLKWFAERLWNHYLLDHIEDELDFIGLNYYFHNRINYGFNKNKNERISDVEWELYPQGIYHVLQDLKKYLKPIYVTENGLADARDTQRAWFIKESLAAVSKAIQSGVDVRGYFHWSLLDNFEWEKGFWPRFGLLEVNYRTLRRTIRPSALKYREIIEKSLENSPYLTKT